MLWKNTPADQETRIIGSQYYDYENRYMGEESGFKKVPKAILLYHQGSDLLDDISDEYLSKRYSMEKRIKSYMLPKWVIVIAEWDDLNRPRVMNKYVLNNSKLQKRIYDNVVAGRDPFDNVSYDYDQFDTVLGVYKFDYVGDSLLVNKITTYYMDVGCKTSCTTPDGIENPIPGYYYTQSLIYETEFDGVSGLAHTTYYRTNFEQGSDSPIEVPFYKERLSFTYKKNLEKQQGYSIIAGLNNGVAHYDVPFMDYGYDYIESNYEQLPNYDIFQLGYVDIGGASDYLYDLTFPSILAAELDEGYRDKGLFAIEVLSSYIGEREIAVMAGALNSIAVP